MDNIQKRHDTKQSTYLARLEANLDIWEILPFLCVFSCALFAEHFSVGWATAEFSNQTNDIICSVFVVGVPAFPESDMDDNC